MNIKRFLQPMYKPEPTGGSSKKYLNARVQMKKDTAANWEAANPVILAGEFIIVITASGETRFKVGDGTKRYTQLPFTDEPIRGLIGEKLGKTEAAAKVQNKLSVFGQEYDGSAGVTIDVIGDATTTQSGLMSAADKKTLGDITPFIVTITYDASVGGIYRINKTYNEIKAAADSGKVIYGLYNNGYIQGIFDSERQSVIFNIEDVIYDVTKNNEQTNYIEYEGKRIQKETLVLTSNNVLSFYQFNIENFNDVSGIVKFDPDANKVSSAVPGTDYAAATHTHTIAQVTDLETRLAALEAREIGTKVTLYRYVSA